METATDSNMPDLTKVAQQLEKEIPPGPKYEQIRRLLEMAPNLLIGGVEITKFIDESNTVDDLTRLITDNSKATTEFITNALENDKSSFCAKLREEYVKAIQKVQEEIAARFQLENKSSSWWYSLLKKCSIASETKALETIRDDQIKIRDQYISAIKNVQQETADKMLRSCSLSAFIVVFSETVRLLTIWNHIKDAGNCIFDNVDKDEIEKNLEDIESRIKELQVLQLDFSTSTDSDTINNIIDASEGILLETSTLITKTTCLLAEVKADINGKKLLLLSDDESLTVSLTTNAVQIALNAFRFWAGMDSATNRWKIICGSSITAQVFVSGFGIYTKIVTQDTIQQCRRVYQEIKNMDSIISGQEKQAAQIRKWLRLVQRSLKNSDNN